MGTEPTVTYRLPDGRRVEVHESACRYAQTIPYTLADGSIVEAELIGFDPRHDLREVIDELLFRRHPHLESTGADDPTLAEFLAAGIGDTLTAVLVDAAPGPGSVRLWEHPELPELRFFPGSDLAFYHVPDDAGGWRALPNLPSGGSQ